MSTLSTVVALAQLPRAGFDDEQAARLVENAEAFQLWLQRHGLMFSSPEARAVTAQALASWTADENAPAEAPVPEEAVPPAAAHPRRFDTVELRAFAATFPWLSPRMREVFELCIQQGLSLNECGERLGISRETVRVHLRRLRGLRKRFAMPGAPPA